MSRPHSVISRLVFIQLFLHSQKLGDPLTAIQFSVIVPVRNLQSRLKQVLPALLRQLEVHTDFELILGDDASDDSSARILQDLQGKERVQVHLAPHHLGRSLMRNWLCKHATGEWLIFLDGDCVPADDWGQAYKDACRGQNTFVGHVLYENSQHSGLNHFLSYQSGPVRLSPGFDLSCSYFTTGNSAVLRSAFEKVGGFSNHFRGWGGEDYDLGLKLELAGYPLLFCRKSQVYHPALKIRMGYFERLFQFGAENLRQLIADYPNKKDIFHINRLEQKSLRYVLLHWKLGSLLQNLLKSADRIKWPALFYRLAIFSSYAQGYLANQKK